MHGRAETPFPDQTVRDECSLSSEVEIVILPGWGDMVEMLELEPEHEPNLVAWGDVQLGKW